MPDSNYNELITFAQKSLYHYIYSITGNQADAWDILQEVNLVLLRKEGDFEVGTNFQAWSKTIARFQIINFIRKKQRSTVDFLTPEIAEVLALDLDTIAEGCSDYELHQKDALQYCLSKLTNRSQRVINLFYNEGRSIKDIMPLTQMTESSVKQTLRRARLSLQQCIELRTQHYSI